MEYSNQPLYLGSDLLTKFWNMGSYLPLLIQLASGALGGNLAGKLMKNASMGTLWNSVAGIVGGGIGGKVLGMLGAGSLAAAAQSGGMDVGSILASVAGGGVGGGILMAIIGFIKKAMASKAS